MSLRWKRALPGRCWSAAGHRLAVPVLEDATCREARRAAPCAAPPDRARSRRRAQAPRPRSRSSRARSAGCTPSRPGGFRRARAARRDRRSRRAPGARFRARPRRPPSPRACLRVPATTPPPDTGASTYAMPVRASAFRHLPRSPGLDRRGVEDDEARTATGRRCPRARAPRCSTAAAVRQGQHDHVDLGGERGDRRGAARTSGGERRERRIAEVAHHDGRQATRRQRLRHRPAHRPEADHADGDRHHSKSAVSTPANPKSTETWSPGAQKQCPVQVPVLTISPASSPRPRLRSQFTSQVSDVSG